ncbi:MAG: VOC family protein [Caldilineaceae bacterium]|nr:VOC family protein [Caldilineaceae bacterium]HRJ42479.1 VOC family protein [Caldilineaceae bacterium]
MFTGLDHVAIVVPDTEEALKTFRDKLGLTLLYSEVVNNGAVRLTHLDAGNTHVQLVQPLTPDHPLHGDLQKKGIHLNHICFKVENVDDAMTEAPSHGLAVAQAKPHQGTQGKRAFFIDRAATEGVPVEVTGK